LARCRLLHLRRTSVCFGTSRGLSRDSSSTTSPRVGSSSTTSPTSCVRVSRHVAWLVAPLVVDYFDYAARLGDSTRRAARRRLLRLCRSSGCLGTSWGSSRGSPLTTSTTPRIQVPRHVARLVTRLVVPLVVDYFDYTTRPGASECRATRHAARRAARCRLLRLRRASGCIGTSRGSSPGSSSTTSPTSHVNLLRHIAWLVA
jgi:hypothetical protein